RSLTPMWGDARQGPVHWTGVPSMGVSALIRSALIPALAFMMAAAGAIAHASDAGDGNAVTQMATQLRADLAAGEKYPDLAESDRRRVLELLARTETR